MASPPDKLWHLYYFIYLTNWGYILVGFHNLVDFIVTLYVHVRRSDIVHLSPKSDQMPWYIKLLWILFEINNSISVLITIAFYSLLTPSGDPTSIEKHAINSVYVLLNKGNSSIPLFKTHKSRDKKQNRDNKLKPEKVSPNTEANHFVCVKPVRLLHVIYPLIIGVIYVIFSVIYQVGGDGAAIYPVLDWDQAETTIIYFVVLTCIGVPVVHMDFFAMYQLRIFIHDKRYAKNIVQCCTEQTAIRTGESGVTSYM
ncbi:protein rolling stone-like [Mytilus galloprovincialis]|uniref:protein rolling stone-like n=1 Tax=Mytilus galloprovincialis TaxID=29158 RepID=UPI003F7C48A7